MTSKQRLPWASRPRHSYWRTRVWGMAYVSPNPCLTQSGNVGTAVRAPQCLRPYDRDLPPYRHFLQTHHTSHRLQSDSEPAVLSIPGRVRPLPSLDQLKKDDCFQGKYGAARWGDHTAT